MDTFRSSGQKIFLRMCPICVYPIYTIHRTNQEVVALLSNLGALSLFIELAKAPRINRDGFMEISNINQTQNLTQNVLEGAAVALGAC